MLMKIINDPQEKNRTNPDDWGDKYSPVAIAAKAKVSPIFRILLKIEACRSIVKKAQINKNNPKICNPIPKFVGVGIFSLMPVSLKISPREKPNKIKKINFNVS